MRYCDLNRGEKFHILEIDGKIVQNEGVYEKLDENCFIKHVPPLEYLNLRLRCVLI